MTASAGETDRYATCDAGDNCPTVIGNQFNFDGDGAPNGHDDCPSDPYKSAPGNYGCGVDDTIDFVGFLPPIGGGDATGRVGSR